MKLKTAEQFRKEDTILFANHVQGGTRNWLILIADVLITILARLERAEGKDNDACLGGK